MGLARLIWHRYVTETIELADRAEREARAADPRRATVKMVVILFTSALALTAIAFGSRDSAWLVSLLDTLGFAPLADRLASATRTQFGQLVFWALVSIAGYVIPAVIVIRLLFRERVRDFGLGVRGTWRYWPLYAGLMAGAVPFLVYLAYSPSFQATYPFYDLAPDEGLVPRMALWWFLYAAQFVALEFFFRGFMVHGLKDRVGYAAIFVMLVPYNMIHFQKPMPEALAAIGGGAILGTLSLRSGSIWWGAALHIGIAGSMDVLSLAHKGLL
jgi:CAAX protease family protein